MGVRVKETTIDTKIETDKVIIATGSEAASLPFISLDGERVITSTEALELKPLLSRPVTRLSGGEQQRVNLARALWQVWAAIEAGEALLVLDEPMQGLDIRHQLTFLTFLQQLCQQGNTTIISSHDLTLSARFASHAMLLNSGRHIASGDISQVFTPANLKMGYGIAFDISNNQNTLQIHPKWPPVLP